MKQTVAQSADADDQRLLQSRRTLVQWESLSDEARGSALVASVARTEIRVLEDLLNRAPPRKRPKTQALIERWHALSATREHK